MKGKPKKLEIKRSDPNAPEEFYFVHIEHRDLIEDSSEEDSSDCEFSEEESSFDSSDSSICFLFLGTYGFTVIPKFSINISISFFSSNCTINSGVSFSLVKGEILCTLYQSSIAALS